MNATVRLLGVLLLLITPVVSSARTRCAANEDIPGRFGLVVDAGPQTWGTFAVWECWEIVDEAGQPAAEGQWMRTARYCNEATWEELGVNPLANLGSRLDTVRKAADPVAAFHSSYARHVKRASPRCDEILKSYRSTQ